MTKDILEILVLLAALMEIWEICRTTDISKLSGLMRQINDGIEQYQSPLPLFEKAIPKREAKLTKAALYILENEREVKSKEELIMFLSRLAKEDMTLLQNLFQTDREAPLKARLWNDGVLVHQESLAQEAHAVVQGFGDGSRLDSFSPIR